MKTQKSVLCLLSYDSIFMPFYLCISTMNYLVVNVPALLRNTLNLYLLMPSDYPALELQFFLC